MKTRKLVFVGPSLTPDDKTNFNQAQYAPPCEEGDVIRAMDAGFKAVGIIDGFFGDRRAVSHKEILLALSKGVAVYGAASMGALRAAELDSWGMQGVGSIYEKYRCGKFMDDGDVAVTHGPAELEFPVTSLAVVDVEATLASLVARRQITDYEMKRLMDVARGIFYVERSWAALAEAGFKDTETQTQMTQLFTSGAVQAKRLDALALMQKFEHNALPDLFHRPAPPPKTFSFAKDLKRARGGIPDINQAAFKAKAS